MATLAHLSDVHFGAHDPGVIDGLEAILVERRPDLVVVSGDFTQRARVEQFRQACEFLDRLEQAGLVTLGVPGNHDVPFYDFVRRFTRPLNRYRRFIDDDLCPWFESDEIAVLGINTARSLTFKEGRISQDQMGLIRECFRDVTRDKARILVTHHPLVAMPIGEEEALTKVAGRSDAALKAVGDAGVRILLAGHFHRSFSRSAREMVRTAGPELVIQAGTAASIRLRGGEQQSFNWIETNGPDNVRLAVQTWTGKAFEPAAASSFTYDGEVWT